MHAPETQGDRQFVELGERYCLFQHMYHLNPLLDLLVQRQMVGLASMFAMQFVRKHQASKHL